MIAKNARHTPLLYSKPFCCFTFFQDRPFKVAVHFLYQSNSLSRCIESGKYFRAYRGAIHSLTCNSIFLRIKIWSMVLLFSPAKAYQLLPEDVVNAFLDSNYKHLYKILLMTGKSVIVQCTLKKVALEWKRFWTAGIQMKWRCDHRRWPAPNMWLFNLHSSVGRALQRKTQSPLVRISLKSRLK